MVEETCSNEQRRASTRDTPGAAWGLGRQGEDPDAGPRSADRPPTSWEGLLRCAGLCATTRSPPCGSKLGQVWYEFPIGSIEVP